MEPSRYECQLDSLLGAFGSQANLRSLRSRKCPQAFGSSVLSATQVGSVLGGFGGSLSTNEAVTLGSLLGGFGTAASGLAAARLIPGWLWERREFLAARQHLVNCSVGLVRRSVDRSSARCWADLAGRRKPLCWAGVGWFWRHADLQSVGFAAGWFWWLRVGHGFGTPVGWIRCRPEFFAAGIVVGRIRWHGRQRGPWCGAGRLRSGRAHECPAWFAAGCLRRSGQYHIRLAHQKWRRRLAVRY